MINFKKAEKDTVELDFEGDITGEDFKRVTPKIEDFMRKNGKVKFLMDLTRVKNFNLGAVYQDIKFDLQHFKNIGATAVVASKKTYEMMTKFLNTVYPEKVHHFETQEEAANWLRGQAA